MIKYIRDLLAGGTERHELDKTTALLKAMKARGMGATPGHMSVNIRQQALSAVELAERMRAQDWRDGGHVGNPAELASLVQAGREATA